MIFSQFDMYTILTPFILQCASKRMKVITLTFRFQSITMTAVRKTQLSSKITARPTFGLQKELNFIWLLFMFTLKFLLVCMHVDINIINNCNYFPFIIKMNLKCQYF